VELFVLAALVIGDGVLAIKVGVFVCLQGFRHD
jgi:hypothetical protein